jgi:hypothetical protein
MLKFVPVAIKDHDAILGCDFSSRFAAEMADYYAPFLKKGRDIQVAKETWEYAVADSIDNAVWVGAGKNIIDVDAPNADFDVKGISAEVMRGQTTEASLLQNNKKKNDNVLTLFANHDWPALKAMFIDAWSAKVKDTNNLHLIAIVREKSTKKVYYCLLKIEEDATLTEDVFLNKFTLDADRGVEVPMIDSKFGKTYIYMPKRRLEIRLNCDGLKNYLVFSHHY